MITERLDVPIHPGEVLTEDFIEGLGIAQYKFAESIGVPPWRINEMVHGKRANAALHLGCSSRMHANVDDVALSVAVREARDAPLFGCERVHDFTTCLDSATVGGFDIIDED